MPAPHILQPGYANRLRLQVETKLALQRHLDSQRETQGITVPKQWYMLATFPKRLGIRMVATTERGQKTLQAMEERSNISTWRHRTHHKWKACLENGDIKAVLEKEEQAAGEDLAPKPRSVPVPRTVNPGYANRIRCKAESKLALQRHLGKVTNQLNPKSLPSQRVDSQRETRGITMPRYWCILSKLPEKIGIRMVATTARGLQTLEAIAACPRIDIWRLGTHRDWKECLEYGDIRAVITGEGERAPDEEEAVSQVTPTRKARRQAKTAAARAVRAVKARLRRTGGERTTGGEQTTPRAKRVTRRAIAEEVMRPAMSEELADDEDDAEVKVEAGEAPGSKGPGAALGPDAQRLDENNVTDQPELEERRNKRPRTTQSNRQIGFGLEKNRAQSPFSRNGSPRTDDEAHTEAARPQRCMFSVEIPVLIHDTIVVGGQIGSSVSRPPPSPPQRTNKRARREDTEVQRDRQIEAAHQDANAIVGAVRTIGSELSAVIMASRPAPVPVDGQNVPEGRLVALEQGQRRLEGMMLEMLGHVRPAPQT